MKLYINNRKILLFLFIIAITVILDQWTKLLVVKNLHSFYNYYILTSFVNIVYVINKGISFGILANYGVNHAFLGVIAIFTVFFIVYWLITTKENDVQIALTFVIGGAIGNIIDRFRIKGVIDFIDLHINNYHWPAFNVADSFIVLGITYIIFTLIFTKGDQNNA